MIIYVETLTVITTYYGHAVNYNSNLYNVSVNNFVHLRSTVESAHQMHIGIKTSAHLLKVTSHICLRSCDLLAKICINHS